MILYSHYHFIGIGTLFGIIQFLVLRTDYPYVLDGACGNLVQRSAHLYTKAYRQRCLYKRYSVLAVQILVYKVTSVNNCGISVHMNTERIQRYLVPYYLKLHVNAVNLVLGFLAHKKLALNAVKYITVKHYKVLTLNGGFKSGNDNLTTEITLEMEQIKEVK